MTTLTLTQQEIALITGRKRFTAQCRQLAKMGIEHRLSATGEPIVSRAHFEQVMGVQVDSANDNGGELHLDFLAG